MVHNLIIRPYFLCCFNILFFVPLRATFQKTTPTKLYEFLSCPSGHLGKIGPKRHQTCQTKTMQKSLQEVPWEPTTFIFRGNFTHIPRA